MSSDQRPFSVCCFLAGTLLACSVFVTGASLTAQVERAVHTETVESFRLEAEGYDTPATLDLELSNPVPLDGVTAWFLDTPVFTLEREGAGRDIRLTRIAILSQGVEVDSTSNLEVGRARGQGYSGTSWRISSRIQEPTDAFADALRVTVWASRDEPGGVAALSTIFARDDELRVHFVKGTIPRMNEGPGHHERRIAEIEAQTLVGAGTTQWREHTFTTPVTTSQLKFVWTNFLGATYSGYGRGGVMSECQLVLDTDSADPDRYVTLDDAFSPSRGVPAADWLSADHSLLLDADTRVRLRDRSIVGFRWHLHGTGGDDNESWIRVGTNGDVSLIFLYDDRDCDSDDCGEVGFLRGDANADTKTDLSDAVFVLAYLFAGGDEPSCLSAADSSDDGGVDVSDPVYLLNHLFLGGPQPNAPFVECGTDPTADELTCEWFGPCEG